METEAKDPFVARLEPEKVNYLEQEGWSLSLDGTQFTKVWNNGSQSEIDFDHVAGLESPGVERSARLIPTAQVTQGSRNSHGPAPA